MKVTATFKASGDLGRFLKGLSGPAFQQAAARGLTEHAHEQRRRSIVTVTAITGLPKGVVAAPMKVIPARGGASMQAEVQAAKAPIGLEEYGNPGGWSRDLNPGWKGGAVSSSPGVTATAWNVTKVFRGTWLAKGQVWKREDRSDPRSRAKKLWGVILGRELANPKWTNVPKAEAYAALDLEKRVLRHVMRALGT